jgi:DNA-binding NtrC family response regulator
VSASILVIDDETSIRETLVEFFETFQWTATGAATAAAARSALAAHPPDVVLLDLRLPDADGVRFLDALRTEWPDVAVIVLTGHADVPTAVRSMQRGAIDLLQKPVDLDVLAATVRRALALSHLRREVELLRARHAAPAGWATTVAPAVEQAVLAAAAHDRPVVIVGEMGTGRGELARLLHRSSARAAAPFVDVDCTDRSTESFAAELYGAVGDRRAPGRGLLEIADAGTVLIANVDHLHDDAWPRLLQLLEDSRFQRVALGRSFVSSARLVLTRAPARTDGSPLPSALGQLSRVELIEVPALRQRTDELAQLARALLPSGASLTDDAVQAIERYAWPGNLRELRFTLWRAALVAPSRPISPSELGLPHQRASTGVALEAIERDAIRAALRAAGGNRSRAARELGIARSTLHLKLAAIDLSDNRTEQES